LDRRAQAAPRHGYRARRERWNMRLIAAWLSLVLLAAAVPAGAQTAAPESRAAERPRRAPLAVPEDFAPAVDVSRQPAAPAASAASTAPQREGAPAAASSAGG